MRAEFLRPAQPGRPLGSARWTGSGVEVQAADPGDALAIRRVFRSTAVVVEDPALRSFGASGPAVLQPGSLEWFHAAARTRGLAEGMTVRMVPEGHGVGFDPAGSYRSFAEQLARRERSASGGS